MVQQSSARRCFNMEVFAHTATNIGPKRQSYSRRFAFLDERIHMPATAMDPEPRGFSSAHALAADYYSCSMLQRYIHQHQHPRRQTNTIAMKSASPLTNHHRQKHPTYRHDQLPLIIPCPEELGRIPQVTRLYTKMPSWM